jgi:hypothetical protein
VQGRVGMGKHFGAGLHSRIVVILVVADVGRGSKVGGGEGYVARREMRS